MRQILGRRPTDYFMRRRQDCQAGACLEPTFRTLVGVWPSPHLHQILQPLHMRTLIQPEPLSQWDARHKTCLHTFYDHAAMVNACAMNPDGTCVASVSHDRTIKLWDLRTHQILQHHEAHDEAVSLPNWLRIPRLL